MQILMDDLFNHYCLTQEFDIIIEHYNLLVEV